MPKTDDELLSKINAAVEPKTMSVPAAGKQYFGLSRASSYAAAARGDLPTIRIGRKLCVPVIALERMLDQVEPRHRQDAAA